MLCYSWTNSQEQKFSADIPPKKNFQGYELLTLKTKLYPFVHHEFGRNKEIKFHTSNKGVLHKIFLNLYDGGGIYHLTREQEKKMQYQINKIVTETPSEFACVFSYQHFIGYQTGYPSIAWIQSILKYIKLDPKYEAYITDDGMYAKVIHHPKKYVKDVIHRPEEYVEILRQEVESQLLEMYCKGTVYQPSSELITSWDLEVQSSDEQLYQFPQDDRIRGELELAYDSVTDFLLTLMKGSDKIYIRIGANNAKRHLVSTFLKSIRLSHVYLSFYLVIPVVPKDFFGILITHIERLFTEVDLHVISHDMEPSKPIPVNVLEYNLANGRKILSKQIPLIDNFFDYENVYEEVIDYRQPTVQPFLLKEEVDIKTPETIHLQHSYSFSRQALPEPEQGMFWSLQIPALLEKET